ncbi:MAG TPA: phosphoribosyltransferase family protein, partial [Candidatus Angelobacter sp.]|nr:phosphoribosyltransferase family protein [Candidatus Angelobacter sp.]
LGRRVEGFQEKGAAVVIVDDVCTTGGSTIQAIEAAREFGFQIAGVACLVERLEAGGRPAVEKAAAPAPFVSIFTSDDVKAAHLRLKTASPQTFAYSGACEICGRPAVTNSPGLRCDVHRV